jgi:hypothetical protein
MGVMN